MQIYKLKFYSIISLKFLIVFFSMSIVSVLLMKILPPATTAFMVIDEWGNADNYEIKYKWVDWEDISPYVPLAVVAAEDQKFLEHNGFDFESISEAWEEHQSGERYRGASSISQQVAKNLYLWSGRSFIRKGLEAYFTVLIELFWSKKRILEVYVNIAQFGQGIYGVGAASEVYFQKSATKVAYYQAALMAAVLPNPNRFKINRPSPYVLERTQWILKQMDQLGWETFILQIDD